MAAYACPAPCDCEFAFSPAISPHLLTPAAPAGRPSIHDVRHDQDDYSSACYLMIILVPSLPISYNFLYSVFQLWPNEDYPGSDQSLMSFKNLLWPKKACLVRIEHWF